MFQLCELASVPIQSASRVHTNGVVALVRSNPHEGCRPDSYRVGIKRFRGGLKGRHRRWFSCDLSALDVSQHSGFNRCGWHAVSSLARFFGCFRRINLITSRAPGSPLRSQCDDFGIHIHMASSDHEPGIRRSLERKRTMIHHAT